MALSPRARGGTSPLSSPACSAPARSQAERDPARRDEFEPLPSPRSGSGPTCRGASCGTRARAPSYARFRARRGLVRGSRVPENLCDFRRVTMPPRKAAIFGKLDFASDEFTSHVLPLRQRRIPQSSRFSAPAERAAQGRPAARHHLPHWSDLRQTQRRETDSTRRWMPPMRTARPL
jgi:hypothetical protein